MRRLALTLVLALSAVSPVMARGISAFSGHWVNRDQNTRGIEKLYINQAGNVLSVQAWAKTSGKKHNQNTTKMDKYHDKHKGHGHTKWGKPNQYDNSMGKKIGIPYSINVDTKVANNTHAVIANFDNSFSKRTLLIEAPFGKTLRVREFVSFTDRSNRSAYTSSYRFKKTEVKHPSYARDLEETVAVPVRPELVHPVRPEVVYPVRPEVVYPVKPEIHVPHQMKEDKIKFDWRKLRVKKVNNRWKIMEGTSHMMMDFGSNLREASQSLMVIQRYRMNEMCYVGRPDPSMTYFLCDGKSPVGEKPNEDSIKFNPRKLSVRKVNNSWKIVEGKSHWMMDFGSNEREARQSLRVILKYGFTHMCFIGRPKPSMTYFRK